MLDQAEIDRLVSVTKVPLPSTAPQLPQFSTGHLRSNFDLQSRDGEDLLPPDGSPHTTNPPANRWAWMVVATGVASW